VWLASARTIKAAHRLLSRAGVKLFLVATVLAVSPLLGCSNNAGESGSATGGMAGTSAGGAGGLGGNGGGGTDAQATCPEGSHTEATGCASTLQVAKSAQALPAALDHHVTLVVETNAGPFVYVIGGTDSWTAMMSEVRRAPIL